VRLLSITVIPFGDDPRNYDGGRRNRAFIRSLDQTRITRKVERLSGSMIYVKKRKTHKPSYGEERVSFDLFEVDDQTPKGSASSEVYQGRKKGRQSF